MPTGLMRRGARYCIRRRVPVDLIPHYGKTEIVRALRTSDPKEARVRLALEWVALDQEFEAAKLTLQTPTVTDERPLSRISPTVVSLVELDGLREKRDAAAANGELADFNRFYRDALRIMQAMLDGEVPPSDDLRVIEGKRNAVRAMLTGENAFAISAARKARQAIAEAEQQADQQTRTSLNTLIEKWARERARTGKSLEDHSAVVRWFEERVGTVPLEEVTKRHVLTFKDKLLEEGQTPANINVKLARLRTLLNYAFDNDLIKSQPAAGISVKDTGRNKRKPFDLEALKALFSGPVHAKGERPIRGRGEAAYWLPLLALYTGARLEELCQLRPGDVRETTYPGADGVTSSAWLIHITDDAEDDLKVKNAGSVRAIPVHPVLRELGFVEFAAKGAAAGNARLFTELRPNKYGRFGAKWGEWFSVYLREICGVTDKRIVFHSFRHAFKDNARNSGIAEGIQRQIMGHSGKDVADEYGEGFSLHQVVKGMSMYNIPGFIIPPKPQ